MTNISTLNYIKKSRSLNDEQFKQLAFITENVDKVQGELVKISASAAILTISQNLAEEIFFEKKNNSCEEINSSEITKKKISEFFSALSQLRIRRSTDDKITEENIDVFYERLTKKDTINKSDIDEFIKELYTEKFILGITNRIDPKAIEDHHKANNIIRMNYDEIQTTIDLYIDEAKSKKSPLASELINLKSEFSLYRENLAEFPEISKKLKEQYPEIKLKLREHEVVSNPIVKYIEDICHRHHQYNFARDNNNTENANELVLLDNHSKSIYRIIEKAFKEKLGDFSQITDASRASLVYDDSYTLSRAIKNLLFVAETKGHQINEVNDLMVKSGTSHIKFLIGIKLEENNIFNCELQFIDQAQKQADRYSHQIYGLMRDITGEDRSIDINLVEPKIVPYAEKLDKIITILNNPNDSFLRKIKNVQLGDDTIGNIVDELEKINMYKTYKGLGIEEVSSIGTAEKKFLDQSFELLNKAHLFIICAALKSRDSLELDGEGLSDQSVSALYAKLAGDLNYKNIANPNKQIPQDYLPAAEKDFEKNHFEFAEDLVKFVRAVGKEVKQFLAK